jgi:DNA-binding GntR family transcriptional regulator
MVDNPSAILAGMHSTRFRIAPIHEGWIPPEMRKTISRQRMPPKADVKRAGSDTVVIDEERERLRPKQPYAGRAYEYIKRSIIDSSLKPGADISDAEIAARLGISRTPVREAMRQLELEGLVLHAPHRGWTVCMQQARDIQEMFEIKESLETMLVRQAVMNLTAEDKAVLVKSMASLEDATTRKDLDAWLAADECLQDTLFAAASNVRAKQIVASLNAQWHWIWLRLISLEDRMNQSAKEHRAILDQVLAGDAEGAARLMSGHITSVKRYLLSLLTNFVLPFTERLAGSGAAPTSSLARKRS